ncbi:hypothetical protein ACOMHN_059426 [Nucella lapillus]
MKMFSGRSALVKPTPDLLLLLSTNSTQWEVCPGPTYPRPPPPPINQFHPVGGLPWSNLPPTSSSSYQPIPPSGRSALVQPTPGLLLLLSTNSTQWEVCPGPTYPRPPPPPINQFHPVGGLPWSNLPPTSSSSYQPIPPSGRSALVQPAPDLLLLLSTNSTQWEVCPGPTYPRPPPSPINQFHPVGGLPWSNLPPTSSSSSYPGKKVQTLTIMGNATVVTAQQQR